MIPSISSHPTSAELSAFSLGLLDDVVSAQIEQHLMECSDCCQSLEPTSNDRLTDLVRNSAALASLGDLPTSLKLGYEIVEEVGRGGMGVVYKALQLGLGRVVALKRMHVPTPSGIELARFRREAGAIARLAHPNIVQVFDFGEQGQTPYLALEFVAGPNLAQRLNAIPIPARPAATLVEILARAIDHAHRAGIVHRDLKPGNILLSGEVASPHDWGTPKIADFGLARSIDNLSQTATGTLQGTPGYMAPEQISAAPDAMGPAVDIYSLGAILYEALAGRPPFRAATLLETLHLASTTEPISLRRLQPGVPRDLDTIVDKCLDRSPVRRYATATELADDLQRFLSGQPILARPAGIVERCWKWARRRPAIAALIGLSLVSVVVFVSETTRHRQRLQVEVNRAKAAEELALTHLHQGHDALHQLILEIYRDHPETPAFDALSERVDDQALAFYYGVLKDADESNRGVRIAKGMLVLHAGSMHVAMRRFERALPDLEESRRLLEPLVADSQFRDKARWYLAACHRNLGNVYRGLRRFDDATQEFGKALNLNRELISEKAAFSGLIERQAHCQELLSRTLVDRQFTASACTELQQAIDLRLQELQYNPENAENRAMLALDYGEMGVLKIVERLSDEADAQLQKAEALLRDATLTVRSLRLQNAECRICYIWGVVELSRGRNDESLAHHERGIAFAEMLRAREPQDRTVLFHLHTLWRGKAWVLCRSGRAEESFPCWERAIEYAEGDERAFCRSERALERALLGQCVAATTEANEIAKLSDLSANVLIHLARVYSRAIESAPRDSAFVSPVACADAKRSYAEQGVECLRRMQHVATPSSSRLSEIQADPAIESLRATEQFQQWWSTIETPPESKDR